MTHECPQCGGQDFSTTDGERYIQCADCGYDGPNPCVEGDEQGAV